MCSRTQIISPIPGALPKRYQKKRKMNIQLAHHSTDFYCCNFSCLNRMVKEQKALVKDSGMRKLSNPLKHMGSNSTLEAEDCQVRSQFWNGVANKLDPIPALMEVMAKQKIQARRINPGRGQDTRRPTPKSETLQWGLVSAISQALWDSDACSSLRTTD